jgi:hypothetical protein
MRIPIDLDQATEIAGRPLQAISRFQLYETLRQEAN